MARKPAPKRRRAPASKPAPAPVAVVTPAPATEIDAAAANPPAAQQDGAEGSNSAVAQEIAPVEAPAADTAAPAAPEAAPEAEPFPDGNTLIPIAHPEGGTIDGVEKDEHGNLLVRAIDAAKYLAHGFVVVAGDVVDEIEKL